MLDFDDIGGADELIDAVYYHAVVGIFTDGVGSEDVGGGVDGGADELEGDDLEIVGIDNGVRYLADGAASLDAEDRGADKIGVIH